MNPKAIFDQYECRKPPRLLWRVNNKVSRAQREAELRLTTKNQLLPITIREFHEAIENHLNWDNRTKGSCFQSVFSNRDDACDWALDRLEDLQQQYHLDKEDFGIVRLEIDSAKLKEATWIFDARELATTLGLQARPLLGEYLVYSEISFRAVVARSRLCELKKESSKYEPTWSLF